jgi:transcriptional regulator with XRE-family HTH domain
MPRRRSRQVIPMPIRRTAADWPLGPRLRLLLHSVKHPETGRPYTYRSLQVQLATRGVRVSQSHLAHLAAGSRTSATAQLLWALADLFGVPLTFFTGSDTEAVKDLALRTTLDKPELRDLIMQAAQLPDEGQTAVRDLISYLLRHQAG